MEKTNYSQLYARFTKGLSEKTKDILDRRFGVNAEEPETLESIGKDLGITRERVRQIEEAGFTYIRKQNGSALQNACADLALYFEKNGGFKKEDAVLDELGEKKQKPYVLFLLTIGEQFSKVSEKKDYYSYWSTLKNPKTEVKEKLDSLISQLANYGKTLPKQEFHAKFASNGNLSSLLLVSKRIQESRDGKIGLSDWPEIKPRGVKDKAYLVFKKHGKPLHFTEVAKLIDSFEYNQPNKKTYPQTVHNELIKDGRFVLVGRGTYALSEWGYVPGTIKDIITKVLSENKTSLDKDEIVKQVLLQRLVAKNTVLMNLNNKNYFHKDERGNYGLKGAQGKTQTA